MRINEPFVKVSYVLWLISQGASNIKISVDGAEPEHDIVAQILLSRGYFRESLPNSNIPWTGKFSREKTKIIVWSKPGVDVEASFHNGKFLVAECKGEPTTKGVKSGLDLTSFYTALGQLIITADDGEKSFSKLAVVMPDTFRIRERVIRFSQNPRFVNLGIDLVLVDESGNVKQI